VAIIRCRFSTEKTTSIDRLFWKCVDDTPLLQYRQKPPLIIAVLPVTSSFVSIEKLFRRRKVKAVVISNAVLFEQLFDSVLLRYGRWHASSIKYGRK